LGRLNAISAILIPLLRWDEMGKPKLLTGSSVQTPGDSSVQTPGDTVSTWATVQAQQKVKSNGGLQPFG
jgi:hypothetical protein